MLLIVLILLVSFIVLPLLDLTLKDMALFFAKIIVEVLTIVYVLYELFAAGHHAILN